MTTAYFFFGIPHGMSLEESYYRGPIANHFLQLGLELNGDLSITVTEYDGGKRVQHTTNPDRPTSETDKRYHASTPQNRSSAAD